MPILVSRDCQFRLFRIPCNRFVKKLLVNDVPLGKAVYCLHRETVVRSRVKKAGGFAGISVKIMNVAQMVNVLVQLRKHMHYLEVEASIFQQVFHEFISSMELQFISFISLLIGRRKTGSITAYQEMGNKLKLLSGLRHAHWRRQDFFWGGERPGHLMAITPPPQRVRGGGRRPPGRQRSFIFSNDAMYQKMNRVFKNINIFLAQKIYFFLREYSKN